MDSQGRKVIVCDNGTGVRKEFSEHHQNPMCPFCSLSSVDMPAAIFLLIYFHPWLEDLSSGL